MYEQNYKYIKLHMHIFINEILPTGIFYKHGRIKIKDTSPQSFKQIIEQKLYTQPLETFFKL